MLDAGSDTIFVSLAVHCISVLLYFLLIRLYFVCILTHKTDCHSHSNFSRKRSCPIISVICKGISCVYMEVTIQQIDLFIKKCNSALNRHYLLQENTKTLKRRSIFNLVWMLMVKNILMQNWD